MWIVHWLWSAIELMISSHSNAQTYQVTLLFMQNPSYGILLAEHMPTVQRWEWSDDFYALQFNYQHNNSFPPRIDFPRPLKENFPLESAIHIMLVFDFLLYIYMLVSTVFCQNVLQTCLHRVEPAFSANWQLLWEMVLGTQQKIQKVWRIMDMHYECSLLLCMF